MVESEIDNGVFVSRRPAEETTLLQALQRYEHEVTPEKKSAQSERSLIRILCRTKLARRSLASLRGSDFSALASEWKADVGPGTILRRLRLVSHLFKKCRKSWGFAGLQNPIDDIELPKVQDARRRTVKRVAPQDEEDSEDDDITVDRPELPDELDHIAVATGSKVLVPAMRFAVGTAMRRSEIAALEWTHVDLKARVAHLPETKNGHARDVPLSPEMVSLLKGMPGRDGKVFRVRADAITRAFRRALARARKRYELECEEKGRVPSETFLVGLRFHDLRHEATTRLAKTFTDVMRLSAVTGHKDLRMLMRYFHPDARDLANMFHATPQPR
jgi:integrase